MKKTNRIHWTLKALLVLGMSAFSLQSGHAAAAAPAAPDYKLWSDTQGRNVEAEFLKIEGEFVFLRTKDGARHRFPLSSLSEGDQKLAKKLKPLETSTGLTVGSMAASAQAINTMVGRKLIEKKIPANAPCTDEQFVRRIYLDASGATPSYEETKAFIEDRAPDKRAKLIDKLLDSEGFKSTMYNYFADMLRVREVLNDDANLVEGAPYMDYLKKSIAANKPYDVMVKEMLTATGKVWDNGAAGYLLRDSGMLLDNMALTTSLFLGTDIACAQCHDHPFDEWTQMSFYKMAAFYGGTVTQLNGRDFKNGDPSGRLLKECADMAKAKGMTDEEFGNIDNTIGNLLTANRFVVKDIRENRVMLPFDYKYDDAAPNAMVNPEFMKWQDAPKNLSIYNANLKNMETVRGAFAEWMVSKENPRFAITIANRLWKRAMGVGIHEPLNGIKKIEETSNPELITFLGEEMKRTNFDLKAFMRTLYNTKVYQAQVSTKEPVMGEPYYFPGPVLRRMTAEQAWDSLIKLATGDIDTAKRIDSTMYGKAIDLDLENTTAVTVLTKLNAFQNLRRRMDGMVGQTKLGGNEMAKKEEPKDKKDKEKKGMMEEPRTSGSDMPKMEAPTMSVVNYEGMNLMRASELPQPAPGNHFLRMFGQSDRLITDNYNASGSSPQVLMMMNGKVTKMLTDKNSLIFQRIAKEKNPSDKADVIYMALLNRKASMAEKDAAKREFTASGEDAYSNMIWAVINSREFIFVQ